MARKANLPNTLKPNDPDAKSTPQARQEFGFGCLYEWARKGIPALDYEKLPTCQTPGRGPGKPPGRLWCGRTLQRAYDAMHSPPPKGYTTWKGIVARTKLPQSTLRLHDAKGKIDVVMIPRPGSGRRLQKLFPVDEAKALHSKKPPAQFVDAAKRRWITAQHAERTVNGVTCKMLYRALTKNRFRLIDEQPEVNRDAYPGRTYFLAEQVRRFANALRHPPQKPPTVPYVDGAGTTWWTICQTEAITGIRHETLRQFWHGIPASGAGRLLAEWQAIASDAPSKMKIPAQNQAATTRWGKVKAFDDATVNQLARINGQVTSTVNGNGHAEQPIEPQEAKATPPAAGKKSGGRPSKWDKLLELDRELTPPPGKPRDAYIVAQYNKRFANSSHHERRATEENLRAARSYRRRAENAT